MSAVFKDYSYIGSCCVDRSFQQIGPSRIVVELYGVTSNTNWITQLNTAREIRNTWYEQDEDDVMRLFIELNKSGTAVIIATHDITLMEQYDARRLVLHQGRLHIYD